MPGDRYGDDSAEKVEVMHGLGCQMAEFPVAIEAAEKARALGMHVSVGAPNVVRGQFLDAGFASIFADHAPDGLFR